MRPSVRSCVTTMLAAVVVACGAPEDADGERGSTDAGVTTGMFSESSAYERFMGRWSRQLAPALVSFSGVGEDEIVLDVGSGTGALTSAILSTTTTTRAVGIDPSSAYVAFAAQNVGDRATFEVGDAQQLRFSDDSFDRSLSLLVMNFIPDPGKALDELQRVTRTGGVVAAAVWDYGEGMQMLRVFWDEAVALDPSAESRDERHMPLCGPGELAALWREHGLGDVREEPLVIDQEFGSFDDFWGPFLEGQGPAGAYVASLQPDARERLESRLRQRLQPDGDGPIRLTARAWAVRGEAR